MSRRLRIVRAQKFLTPAETPSANATSDKAMIDLLNKLMASSRESCRRSLNRREVVVLE